MSSGHNIAGFISRNVGQAAMLVMKVSGKMSGLRKTVKHLRKSEKEMPVRRFLTGCDRCYKSEVSGTSGRFSYVKSLCLGLAVLLGLCTFKLLSCAVSSTIMIHHLV